MDSPSGQHSSQDIALREAFRTWLRVALYSFGGPAAQISVMHRILVDEKQWISENRFLHALNYCMLLPGPEAQQLATYIGWLLHRTLGGLMAGILFVLPGFIAILALSVLYSGFSGVGWVEALFFGLKPAVLAIVLQALFRVAGRALRNRAMYALAGLAFVAIFFFNVPFPAIIVSAALVGYLGGRLRPDLFHVIRGPEVDEPEPAAHTRPSLGRAVKVSVIFLSLWFVPLIILAGLLGPDSVYVQEGVFFSKAAVVTFGGAYAVLAYIAQQAVDVYGWLKPGEMLDGLGMAETTPGPLIQVVQFVGFMGAYRHAGALDPMTAGILASFLVTWVTFVPCFLWIFLGAPYVEALRGNQALSTALSGITAAVVGVILNLALWFGLHTLFANVQDKQLGYLHLALPEWATLDPAALALSMLAVIALFRLRWPMLRTLFSITLLGMAYRLLVG
ncbi:chromate efflux transporter [Thiohalobacter thiocyanaticus]|uniref:Chromate efflux transporter n=1 Tax=Thiohalobacter thiocyanaticus TaxID=585455 RepID=A0A426QEA4_9GAMM|nr:chromate efflux transporter [Thiohalobacter thiocyanaticus]RRQ20069.1 chromate efflux transporter [Thiohalobacter thiocyanaticus]